METTTQFPVHHGTVVEVTCTYLDAENEGSSEVTCIAGTEFTFLKEPSCIIPGLFVNDDETNENKEVKLQ